MIYKGIETKSEWKNGSWYTRFSKNGELLKTIEWRGAFGGDQIRQIIDEKIIPFI